MGVIKKNWPEFIASLLVIGLLWKVFEQSVLEHHFIIPTMFFTPAVVIGNVIFYSYKNYKWAKIILFWKSKKSSACAMLHTPKHKQESRFEILCGKAENISVLRSCLEKPKINSVLKSCLEEPRIFLF